MANRRWWKNTNFPFYMSFPARILLYIVVDLIVINLIVFYWHENLPLSLVLPVIIIEILALAVAMVYWVPAYNLEW
jgi:hypothetical protein